MFGVEDGVQFYVDMFGVVWCVVDMQYVVGIFEFEGVFYWVVFVCLVVGQVVVVGDVIVFVVQIGLVGGVELVLVGGVGSEDVVVWVQYDYGLDFVFEVRYQGLDLWGLLCGWGGGSWYVGGGV